MCLFDSVRLISAHHATSISSVQHPHFSQNCLLRHQGQMYRVNRLLDTPISLPPLIILKNTMYGENTSWQVQPLRISILLKLSNEPSDRDPTSISRTLLDQHHQLQEEHSTGLHGDPVSCYYPIRTRRLQQNNPLSPLL